VTLRLGRLTWHKKSPASCQALFISFLLTVQPSLKPKLTFQSPCSEDLGCKPKSAGLEDKTTTEQVKLIQELDQEEKHMVFKMIETFLTKKKFKDFFNKNIAAL